MDNWAKFVVLYREELLKGKRKQEIKLRYLHSRLYELQHLHPITSPAICREIKTLEEKIQNTTLTIQAHLVLIKETEDGTLRRP